MSRSWVFPFAVTLVAAMGALVVIDSFALWSPSPATTTRVAAAAPRAGRAAPELVGNTPDGRRGSDVLNKKHAALCMFVSSRSVADQRMLDDVQSAVDRHGRPQGLDIVAVDAGQDPTHRTLGLWRDQGYRLPLLLGPRDDPTANARSFGIEHFPAAVWLSSEGEVVSVTELYGRTSRAALIERLATFLP